MNVLNAWAAVGSLVASLAALVSILYGVFKLGRYAGALSERFDAMEKEVADLKKHREYFNEKLTTLLARCKMCLEGSD